MCAMRSQSSSTLSTLRASKGAVSSGQRGRNYCRGDDVPGPYLTGTESMKLLTLIAASGALASAAHAADRMIPIEDIPCAVEAPGQPQRLGSVWGVRSKGPAGTYLRVPGHWEAPVHTHTADYRAIVIQGVWKHWPASGRKAAAPSLRPGSYWTQTARQWHADACISSSPCTILLINSEPYRTIVKGRK